MNKELTEAELQAIRDEAEKLYPYHFDEGEAGHAAECRERKAYRFGRIEERQRSKELVEVLKGYEQWEADIIGCSEMWWPNAQKDALPQKIYDKMLELQAQRNAVLSPYKKSLQCSLDEQQCQQECEHKTDREKCPFTSNYQNKTP